MHFVLNGLQLGRVGEALCECELERRQIPTLDELTGLANYHGLSETVESEIKRSKRSRRAFAVLVFDLEGMNLINSRHGRLAGDRALCRLACIFHSYCRSIDTAARYAEDKFVLILPVSGAEAADTVERRICQRLSFDREEPLLSVSVGNAVYPGDGETLDTLVQAAVRGLYRVKERRENAATHSGYLPFAIFKQNKVLAPPEVGSLTYAKVERMTK
jgi:diguanylate cyclase (GGDEF)-like protein